MGKETGTRIEKKKRIVKIRVVAKIRVKKRKEVSVILERRIFGDSCGTQ